MPVPLTVLNGIGDDRLHYDLRDVSTRAILHRASLTLSASYPHELQPTRTLLPTALRSASLFSPPLGSISVISRLFPWCIHITGSPQITLDDLLTQLHHELWKTVQENEYWATTEEMRAQIALACHSNCACAAKVASATFSYGSSSASTSSSSIVTQPLTSRPREVMEGIKRVDWLLDRTTLVGLEKDDEFIAARIQDKKRHPSIWVLTLASNATSSSSHLPIISHTFDSDSSVYPILPP